MCAFYRKEGDEDAYTLSPEQIEQRVGIAKQMGATEVHIVGGFHPKLPLDYYEDMMRVIKKNHPELKIKALTAAEIFFLSKLSALLMLPVILITSGIIMAVLFLILP